MPIVVAILLVVGLAYQLFFRFDHWVDSRNTQVVYERDNLTGETHIVREGEKRGFFARLIGNGRGRVSGDSATDSRRDPVALSMIVDRDAANAARERNATASPNLNADGSLARPPLPPAPATTTMAPREERIPEPLNHLMLAPTTATVAPLPVVNVQTQTLDINRDGQSEQILYDRTANDGLMDISILVEHREVFYGRGKALRVLPSQRNGWADIALVIGPAETRVFRYNPLTAMYEVKS